MKEKAEATAKVDEACGHLKEISEDVHREMKATTKALQRLFLVFNSSTYPFFFFDGLHVAGSYKTESLD